MFDLDTLSNSLQVSSLRSGWLIENLLTPDHKNYFWSRVYYNVFALTELRSRVGVFEIPWHPKNHFPIPDLEQPFNKNLSEIIDQRAIEIFNQSKITGKKIVLMWSGGIDSTTMVCAFIKNLSKADLASVIICTTTQGVVENPYFYETQIRNKFEMLHWRDLDFSDQFLDQHILLHGDPGDCIFGPSTSKYKPLWSQEQYKKPWKNSLPILYQLYNDPSNIEFSSWYVDRVSDNLAQLQEQGLYCNIKTISDWHWWNYYNFKWHGSMTRPIANNKKIKKSTISSNNLKEFFDLCFFAGTDFQIWSYQNLPNLITDETRGHKSQAKQYIFELDHNNEYRVSKKKTDSVVPCRKLPLVIGEDGVHYYHNEPDVIHTFRNLLQS